MLGWWSALVRSDRIALTGAVLFVLGLVACTAPAPPPTAAATPVAISPSATAALPTPSLVVATPTPPAPVATPTVTTVPVPPTPNESDVALKGKATASGGQADAQKAIDGDVNTLWSAGDRPVQWYLVTLDRPYQVDRIDLVVAQTPAGKTSHEVWLGDTSGALTLYKKFTDVNTADGQTLVVPVTPAKIVNRVLIRTTNGPSFVAWHEVKVFGTEVSDLALLAATQPGTGEWIDWPTLAMTGGFDLPVQVTNAGDGSGRMFVVEQHGTIRVVKNGEPLSTPFLSIPDLVKCCEEQGMLSIAFPPGYAKKQYFYVSYTQKDDALIVARFKTTANPDVGDPASEQVILNLPEPTIVHHSGHLVFGPKDGYLYIGSGDGGEPADQNNRAQDPNQLQGKLLRIDVESGVTPYAIPPTNPFVNRAGYRPEIWALGLRNPWGFNFDQKTGDLYIGDVGEDKYEEIDYQPANDPGGENYGWHIMEGLHCFFQTTCSQEGLTLPVVEYTHAEGCAVQGGTVYRGEHYPRMQGLYFYADLCTGRIWGLQHNGDTWKTTLLMTAPFQVSSIGEDEAGDLWITDYNHGGIMKLYDQPPATPTPTHN